MPITVNEKFVRVTKNLSPTVMEYLDKFQADHVSDREILNEAAGILEDYARGFREAKPLSEVDLLRKQVDSLQKRIKTLQHSKSA